MMSQGCRVNWWSVDYLRPARSLAATVGPISPAVLRHALDKICGIGYLWNVPISADAFFSSLANKLRLRLVILLQQEGELCVCELTHAVGAAQPTVSRHLAELRRAGLVAGRRQGLWIYYRLHPELPDWAKRVIAATVLGVAVQAPYTEDRRALETMSGRPALNCCD